MVLDEHLQLVSTYCALALSSPEVNSADLPAYGEQCPVEPPKEEVKGKFLGHKEAL
jgi:hypothetical protein